MTAIFLAPVYLGLHVYLFLRLFHWLGAFHRRMASRCFRWIAGAAYAALALSPLAGFLISAGPWHHLFQLVSGFWLGVLLHILMIVGLFDIICLLIRRIARRGGLVFDRRRFCRRAGSLAAACILLISAYGFLHARRIQVHTADLTVTKSCAVRSLKVALIADLHLGYNVGAPMMEQLVEKLNREKVDLVCLAGDIFDNEYESLRQPEKIADILRGIKSRYGVYACWGNHDLRENVLAGFTFRRKEAREEDPRFSDFCQRAGITLLADQTLFIDDAFYLCGRKDPSKSRKMGETRLAPAQLTEGLDPSKPLLVMDHQPRELAELAAAGMDVDLSGHTHNGQLFPGNLLVRLLYENAGGIRRKGEMYTCVTSGVGVWGPAMRVGSDSEIMILNLTFSE
ncbi:MAG: metallophosphoesterase [Clostridiales bacterium]|nr:metallophosphoesterase [Clostridiales bacterium]